ncbi:hypothetical protein ES707_21181 [subsurface metagenome]
MEKEAVVKIGNGDYHFGTINLSESRQSATSFGRLKNSPFGELPALLNCASLKEW